MWLFVVGWIVPQCNIPDGGGRSLPPPPSTRQQGGIYCTYTAHTVHSYVYLKKCVNTASDQLGYRSSVGVTYTCGTNYRTSPLYTIEEFQLGRPLVY
jgi:hypothetical protein